MSSKDKVAKLEGLLARIKDRAAQPRMNGVTAHAAFAAVEEVDLASPASMPATAPVVHSASVAPAPAPLAQSPTIPPPSSIGSRGTTPPPSLTESMPPVAAYTEPPPTHSGAPASLDDSEIEVSAEVVELDIDIDEPSLLPAESGSQPVAEYVGSAELDDAEAEALLATAGPSVAPEAIDVNEVTEVVEMSESPEAVPPANEVVEPAPSSSPRPIAVEEAYEERAPRHTPPPESGKIAAPSVKPDVRKASSAPPVEAPPMMSGWPDVPAQVSAPPPPAAPIAPHVQAAPPPPPPPAPAVHGAPSPLDVAPAFRPPAASGTRLSPEVTRPAYSSDANVASVEGVTPSFAPATFGDLLDASLDL